MVKWRIVKTERLYYQIEKRFLLFFWIPFNKWNYSSKEDAISEINIQIEKENLYKRTDIVWTR